MRTPFACINASPTLCRQVPPSLPEICPAASRMEPYIIEQTVLDQQPCSQSMSFDEACWAFTRDYGSFASLPDQHQRAIAGASKVLLCCFTQIFEAKPAPTEDYNVQMKYCSLRSDSPNVAGAGKPLPTLDQLESKLRLAKKVTLRDVWGLMLCQVPSQLSCLSSDSIFVLLPERCKG